MGYGQLHLSSSLSEPLRACTKDGDCDEPVLLEASTGCRFLVESAALEVSLVRVTGSCARILQPFQNPSALVRRAVPGGVPLAVGTFGAMVLQPSPKAPLESPQKCVECGELALLAVSTSYSLLCNDPSAFQNPPASARSVAIAMSWRRPLAMDFFGTVILQPLRKPP